MSHCKAYNFHDIAMPEDAYDYEYIDDILEALAPYADYVTECEDVNAFKQHLEDIFVNMFGRRNVTRNDNKYTIRKEGALVYFKNLKQCLIDTVTSIQDLPIEEFYGFSSPIGWWQIKNMLDPSFETYFHVPDSAWDTKTRFAETIIYLCDKRKTDSVTLELRQVFDYHC